MLDMTARRDKVTRVLQQQAIDCVPMRATTRILLPRPQQLSHTMAVISVVRLP